MKYQIKESKTDIVLKDCSTLLEANTLIQLYEKEDKVNGDYEPNFYELVEIDTMEDYFENIMRQIESGHKDYALALLSILKKRHRWHFLNWLDETYFYESHDNGEHGSIAQITDILG